jgi:hypothetical protein
MSVMGNLPPIPQRVDYEYERAGTASIFMFAEPLSGFRQATARPQRTKVDWALEVAELLDTRYADCDPVTLVCDNLNTHTIGAFYEAFAPARARSYVRRLAPAARAGSCACNNGSMRTDPVNQSAGPLPDCCDRLISILSSVSFPRVKPVGHSCHAGKAKTAAPPILRKSRRITSAPPPIACHSNSIVSRSGPHVSRPVAFPPVGRTAVFPQQYVAFADRYPEHPLAAGALLRAAQSYGFGDYHLTSSSLSPRVRIPIVEREGYIGCRDYSTTPT